MGNQRSGQVVEIWGGHWRSSPERLAAHGSTLRIRGAPQAVEVIGAQLSLGACAWLQYRNSLREVRSLV
jgi:hypothetical protein